MASGGQIRFAPDMMEPRYEQAMLAAAEKLILNDKSLEQVWPGAYDRYAKKRGATDKLDVGDVELVVMHLDRIGAPAGASGAQIFIVYFAHRPASGKDSDILASPPLVMKLGLPGKLKVEFDFKEKWPTLTDADRARLALPLDLLEVSPELAVLSAPFRSNYRANADGHRHGLSLSDLWSLLHGDAECAPGGVCDIARIGACLDDALELMSHVHRNNRATYARSEAAYKQAYGWYLRDTYKTSVSDDHNAHVIAAMFGDADTVSRFGEEWPNPQKVIARLLEGAGEKFTGAFGPVHGDLHPKNIVVGHGNAVHVIDFGWAYHHHHLLVDYLLLDLNLRGVTLPSQVSETDCVRFGGFLAPADTTALPLSIRARAELIQDKIWKRLSEDGIVKDWRSEYLIPLFIIGYGLLVHLDRARNQAAMLAVVLAAGREIDRAWP